MKVHLCLLANIGMYVWLNKRNLALIKNYVFLSLIDKHILVLIKKLVSRKIKTVYF